MIPHRLTLSPTQSLALKITAAILAFFIVTTGLLTLWAERYFLRLETGEFLQDIAMRANMRGPAIIEMLPPGGRIRRAIAPRMTSPFAGEIHIQSGSLIRAEGVFSSLTLSEEFEEEIHQMDGGISTIESGKRTFLVAKVSRENEVFVLARDITNTVRFRDMARSLFLILILPILAMSYLLSWKIARLTLGPLEKHAENLKSYNRHLAHELKTPLTSLATDIDLLKWENSIRQAGMREEITHMTHTIDDLLVVASQEVPSRSPTDIASTISEMRELFSTEENITVKTEKGTTITCNETLMRSVLRNLLENAIKYRDAGTEIVIEASPTSLRVSNHTSHLSEETLKSLTHDGYRAHSRESGTPGFGIGLSLVEKVAEIHGWNLTFSLKESIFSVIISYGKNPRKN